MLKKSIKLLLLPKVQIVLGNTFLTLVFLNFKKLLLTFNTYVFIQLTNFAIKGKIQSEDNPNNQEMNRNIDITHNLIRYTQWRRKLWNFGEAQGGYIFLALIFIAYLGDLRKWS